jgi:hypothetical protein
MELRVSVSGRYPYPSVFSAENITATAVFEGGAIRVRLDDSRYPDFWLELAVESVRADGDSTDRAVAVKPLHPGCDSGPPVQAG